MLPGIHEPIAQTNDQYPPSKGKTEKFKTCLEKRGRAKKLKWFAGSCLLFDTLCGPVFYFNGLELSISKVFVKPFLFLFFKKRDYTASETLSAFNSIYIIPFFSLERLLLFPAHSAQFSFLVISLLFCGLEGLGFLGPEKRMVGYGKAHLLFGWF